MSSLALIPIYNNADKLVELINYLRNIDIPHLFINDGSTDDTLNILNSYSQNTITIDENAGVSNALRVGYKYCIQHNYINVIQLDADLQHLPIDIPKFLKGLCTNDFVIGNRFSKSGCFVAPTSKINSNKFASELVEHASGKLLNDVACGFRGMSVSCLKDMLPILEKSKDYQLLYDQLSYVLQNKISFKAIDIDCIYYPEKPAVTPRIEMVGLISSLKNSEKDIINFISKRVDEKVSFDVTIKSHYYLHYLSSIDSYLIQK